MQVSSENPIYKTIAAELATTYIHTTIGKPRSWHISSNSEKTSLPV